MTTLLLTTLKLILINTLNQNGRKWYQSVYGTNTAPALALYNICHVFNQNCIKYSIMIYTVYYYITISVKLMGRCHFVTVSLNGGDVETARHTVEVYSQLKLAQHTNSYCSEQHNVLCTVCKNVQFLSEFLHMRFSSFI